jgi:hypothetical protein
MDAPLLAFLAGLIVGNVFKLFRIRNRLYCGFDCCIRRFSRIHGDRIRRRGLKGAVGVFAFERGLRQVLKGSGRLIFGMLSLSSGQFTGWNCRL